MKCKNTTIRNDSSEEHGRDLKKLRSSSDQKNSRSEEKIKDLQDGKEENLGITEGGNSLKRSEHHTRELWEKFKRNNIRTMRILEEQKKTSWMKKQ